MIPSLPFPEQGRQALHASRNDRVAKGFFHRMAWSLAAVIALSLPTLGRAQEAVARFQAGTGSSQVDQFPGVAGEGWADAWKTFRWGPIKVRTEVTGVPTAPRLEVEMAATESSEEFINGSIVRMYNVANRPHQIRFQISLNRVEGDNNPANFFGAFGGVDPHQNTNGSSTWVIRTLGRNPDEWKWAAYHGNGDGGAFASKQLMEIGGRGQGMAVESGKTYEVTIQNHPEKGTYDVAISDGSQIVREEGLKYRAGAAEWAPEQAGIAFQGQLKDGGDAITFSVARVEITPLR